MARKRRGRRRTRGNFQTSKRSLRFNVPETFALSRKMRLNEIEDRRRWNPAGNLYAGVLNMRGKMHSLREYVPRKLKINKVKAFAYSKIGFANPKLMVICARRKIRKMVLHALGQSGGGGAKQKKPTWNYYSRISCGG